MKLDEPLVRALAGRQARVFFASALPNTRRAMRSVKYAISYRDPALQARVSHFLVAGQKIVGARVQYDVFPLSHVYCDFLQFCSAAQRRVDEHALIMFLCSAGSRFFAYSATLRELFCEKKHSCANSCKAFKVLADLVGISCFITVGRLYNAYHCWVTLEDGAIIDVAASIRAKALIRLRGAAVCDYVAAGLAADVW